MKKILLLIISLLIGFSLFFWVVKLTGLGKIRDAFDILSSWSGLAIIFLTVIMAVMGTWKWKEILKGEGINVPLSGLFMPYLAGYAVMLLAPIMVWGGEILRGYFLKEQRGVPWSKGLASVIIDRIFEWTANLVVMVLGLLFFLSKIENFPKNLEFFFGAVFFIFAAAVVFFYFKVSQKESVIKKIAGFFGFEKIEEKSTFLETEKDIFLFFHKNNKAIWRSLAISFLRAGVMLFRVWVLILFLGKAINIFSSISILGFNYLAVMIPIPAALGSHEVIQTFAFGALGMNSQSAAVFTMVIRGAELLISLLGVAVLFKFGIDFTKNLLFKRIEKITDTSITKGEKLE
jgi:uncharacterized protein (TIRG00374 family)